MTKRLQARENFLIIRPDPEVEVSKGGLIISDAHSLKQTDTTGTVFSIGPGVYALSSDGKVVLIPTTIKVGDRILFSPMGGQRIFYEVEPEVITKDENGKETKKFGVETFFVIQQHNIVAFVD